MKEELALKIIHVSKVIVSRLKNDFKQAGYNITLEEWIVLIHAEAIEGLSQAKIAEYTGKDRHFTSRLVTSLENQGCLTRIPDRCDSRINLVYLTKQGKQLVGELNKIQSDSLIKYFSNISDENIKSCSNILNALL